MQVLQQIWAYLPSPLIAELIELFYALLLAWYKGIGTLKRADNWLLPTCSHSEYIRTLLQNERGVQFHHILWQSNHVVDA